MHSSIETSRRALIQTNLQDEESIFDQAHSLSLAYRAVDIEENHIRKEGILYRRKYRYRGPKRHESKQLHHLPGSPAVAEIKITGGKAAWRR